MQPVRIEHAREADVPRLLEIRYAAFSRHAPSAYSPEEGDTLLGDVDEDELRDMTRNWKDANLRHVYVDPDHTRQGIASRLLHHVEADFQSRTGADQIKAGVALHAEPFYVANGYQLIMQARAWDGSEYLEMVKRL